MSKIPIVLFSYARAGINDEDRWSQTGIGSTFFRDFSTARQSVVDLRTEITADGDLEWPTTAIEKIELEPLTKDTLIILLNEGIGSLVKSREVVDTIA